VLEQVIEDIFDEDELAIREWFDGCTSMMRLLIGAEG